MPRRNGKQFSEVDMTLVDRPRSFALFTTLLAAIGVLMIPPGARGAVEPFEINAILPVTGYGAFLGREEVETLTLLADTVNRFGGVRGRPIKFVVQDDQSSPQVGVQLANGLIAKKVSLVIGPALSAVCSAVMPLVKDGPVLYCLTPGVHPPDGSYVFSASISTVDVLAASARYFHDRGWRKVAALTSTDASGQDGERGIMATFTAASGEEIVLDEHFNIADLSVAAQMARIKNSDAQAIVSWATGTPTGTLLRGAAEAGFDKPILVANSNATVAQMRAYAAFLPKELLFPVPPALTPNQLPRGPLRRTIESFRSTLRSAGIKPDIGQMTPWDTGSLAIEAYRRLGFEATPEQIRTFLAGVRGFVGVEGQFDFRGTPQRGLTVNDVVIIRWDAAQDDFVGVSRLAGAPL
jgi:branched-chain amino acid transport system substrate-binding protein